MTSLPRSELTAALAEVYEELLPDDSGEVATYIAPLGRADPSTFAVALAPLDGEPLTIGDVEAEFTIQSVSKALVYGLVLEEVPVDEILATVGVEPSGNSFDDPMLRDGRAPNPLVNQGAIAAVDLLSRRHKSEVFDHIRERFSEICGRTLGFDAECYRAERLTAHRNRAAAHLMKAADVIMSDPDELVDAYCRQCSLLVNVTDLATAAAVLANRGVHPTSGEQVLDSGVVRDVVSVTMSSGMYTGAGRWLVRTGCPSKSGVSGGIMAIGQGLGMATLSPPLDVNGNSVRGVQAIARLADVLDLHPFGGRSRVGPHLDT